MEALKGKGVIKVFCTLRTRIGAWSYRLTLNLYSSVRVYIKSVRSAKVHTGLGLYLACCYNYVR